MNDETMLSEADKLIAAWDRAKGDVEGHDFHGNQWTSGGGSGGEHPSASSMSDQQLQEHMVQEHGLRPATAVGGGFMRSTTEAWHEQHHTEPIYTNRNVSGVPHDVIPMTMEHTHTGA